MTYLSESNTPTLEKVGLSESVGVSIRKQTAIRRPCLSCGDEAMEFSHFCHPDCRQQWIEAEFKKLRFSVGNEGVLS